MKYNYWAISIGFGYFVNFQVDDLGTVALSKLSTPYLAKRVSVELSIGYANTLKGDVGLFGLGLNTIIKDWMIIKEPKENASLLRLSVENAFIPMENLYNLSMDARILRLKHALNLEWLTYKRQVAIYFGIGWMTSPSESFNYSSGEMLTQMGIRFCSPHFKKGAIFERDFSEISQIPINEK